LGQEYVRVAFTPADRARMLEMVMNLEAALGDRIHAAPWMDDSTRAAAAGKLALFANKIGYPQTWKDYSHVTVTRDRHYANRLAPRALERARKRARAGRRAAGGEWTLPPPPVTPYSSPPLNTTTSPAGILQPPFFDPRADDATNYGAIGVVIGHEM